MRVLFVIYYPAYLRYFDVVIAELLRRGHTVRLAFDVPGTTTEGLEALDGAGAALEISDPVPRRGGFWGALALDLRRGMDYARYLHPEFADAGPLRKRVEHTLPFSFGFLARVPSLSRPAARVLLRALLGLERAIPSSPDLERWVASARPDVVVVSPLVNDSTPQTDVLKAAAALEVPSVLAVGSWDHLTTKGLIRVQPDRVLVWNEAQRAEAVELHALPSAKLEVTGAQPFDRWFGRGPSTTAEELRARVGLPPGRPFVLFVGSTATISAPEAELAFVRAWILALRGSGSPEVRELAVLVRPHPYNPGLWAEADVSDLEGVAVWPRAGANPVNEGDRDDYFDSLHHSVAVVGINTSAMIEAAIVGRPVHSIRVPEFSGTQGGTVHFRYLMPEHGGFVRVAESLEEHVALLAETLALPDVVGAQIEGFVRSFIRPRGIERPATPIVVDAVEAAARRGAAAFEAPSPGRRALRALLALSGVAMMLADRERPGGSLARLRRRYEKRLSRALRRRRRGMSRLGRRTVKRGRLLLRRGSGL